MLEGEKNHDLRVGINNNKTLLRLDLSYCDSDCNLWYEVDRDLTKGNIRKFIAKMKRKKKRCENRDLRIRNN